MTSKCLTRRSYSIIIAAGLAGTTAASKSAPANRAMASSESHCVTIRNSMPLPRRRERIEALTKPGMFRSAGNVSSAKVLHVILRLV